LSSVISTGVCFTFQCSASHYT